MYLLSEDSEPPAPVTFLDRKPKWSLQLIIFAPAGQNKSRER